MGRIILIALACIAYGCVTESEWSDGNIARTGDTLKADTTRLNGPER